MPLYEFEDSEGNLMELRRPVSNRNTPVVIDGIRYTRAKSVPSTIVINVPGPTADQQFNERIRKGFYRHEQEQGSSFKGVNGLNKTQLKAVWEDRKSEARH